MVPGFGASADPVLQARMFSYPDAQRYRVGTNYAQLPVNKPINHVYAPYLRDGAATTDHNFGGDPNYVTSELRPVTISKRVLVPNHEQYSGQVTFFSTTVTDKDFVQAGKLWQIISSDEGAKEQFVQSIAGTLVDLPPYLKQQVIGMFSSPTCDHGVRPF